MPQDSSRSWDSLRGYRSVKTEGLKLVMAGILGIRSDISERRAHSKNRRNLPQTPGGNGSKWPLIIAVMALVSSAVWFALVTV